MNKTTLQNALNDCGCCEGQTASTPHRIENRIGLPTIAYRIGDYHKFKQSMLARLSSSDFPELQGLSTRDDHDYSIALIDAWSTVADVLCFYQEYFANEGLLRTAKERLSILEHARLIGYQLRPGVSASGYAAFTMDVPAVSVANPVLETSIIAGAMIQSTPGPDETAQIYETEFDITARVKWNTILPRMQQPQFIDATMQSVVIDGITTFVKPGDYLLLINQAANKIIKKIDDIIIDEVNQITQLKISGDGVSPDNYSINPVDADGAFSDFDGKSTVNDDVINIFINHSWAMEDIIAIVETKHWDLEEITQRINTHADIVDNISAGIGVYGFHKRANLFGYNAMKRVDYDIYGNPLDIAQWKEWTADEAKKTLYLDTEQSEIVANSYLIIHIPEFTLPEFEVVAFSFISDNDSFPSGVSPAIDSVISTDVGNGNSASLPNKVILNTNHSAEKTIAATVNEAVVSTRTEYGISSKTTQLTLSDKDVYYADVTMDMQIIRGASLQVQSEALPLTQVPIDEKITGDSILLEHADLHLRNQQYISIQGERCDQKGTVVDEVHQIKEVRLEHGFTLLSLTNDLKYEYVRNTVTLNANVALVSHGESVSEILGSGDASLKSQVFSLKQIPLTYVSADTSNGVSSTLEVRVNDVLWHEVDTFLGTVSDEKIYTTKLSDEGVTTIYFGDGIEGSRLPSGNNNIIAYYRKGSGLAGLVKSKQLNLLLTRPLGVKDVINPVASSGADDPENLETARINAPLGLLTLDRAVSLQDYEDYSRGFAGISKARAVSVSHNGVPRIYISLAGPDGALIISSSKTYSNLLSSLNNSGDPYTQFMLLSYRPAYFKLDAELYIHSDYINELVLEDARTVMRNKFSFDSREFNQPVHLSEVISALQNVEGVTAVDVNYLYRSDGVPVDPPPGSLMPVISSSTDHIDGAELLTLDPAPLDQIKVKL